VNAPASENDALRFHCTACGNCCRALRVAVTTFDLARLCAHTGRPATELVEWLAPDTVDMTGEPQSFVELSEGRRLMVLRQRGGACHLLGPDQRCQAYSARPRDCRAYPFDFEPDESDIPAARRLRLLPLDRSSCDYTQSGDNDPEALAAEDARRWSELARYQAIVARWNRRAHHRRRLHRAIGAASSFLELALGEVTVSP
jgi:Fe-S-cluster containining protein